MSKLDFELAKQRGIRSAYDSAQFMPYHEDGHGNIIIEKDFAVKMAYDSITAPSVNVPVIFTTFMDPQIVKVLFAVQNATKIFPEERRGDWSYKFDTFAVEEIAGKVMPYSDFAENTSSDVNYNYYSRENFLFQTVIKYGDREVATTARAKIDLVSGKQRSAAAVMAIAHNKFFLYGVAGKQNYGLLNDPNLNPSISPTSVDGKSTWEEKTAAKPDQTANIVYQDVAKLFAELAANNGGLVDANSPLILAISNKMAVYLTTPNQFGLTAMTMLKQNFPNLEVVHLPELSTNAGEMLFMTVPELLGEKTGINAFSEKFFMGRVIPEMSSYKQKVVGGTWGAIIKRPSLVATMLGIG